MEKELKFDDNCIFISELSENTSNYNVIQDELRHIKALRLKDNEAIIALNGKGLSAKGKISFIKKNEAIFTATEYISNFGENTENISLAIGILDNNERFEYALEKAVELGIKEFFPLITAYTQRKTINKKRLTAKALSAIKQCCRSVIPVINEPMTIKQLLKEVTNYEQLILADIDGNDNKNIKKKMSSLIIIGPEGGFNTKEKEFLRNDKRVLSINLGNRRLRAETAAIVGLGLLI